MSRDDYIDGLCLWIVALVVSAIFWLWPTAVIYQDVAQFAKFRENFDSVNALPLIAIMLWGCVLFLMDTRNCALSRIFIVPISPLIGALFSAIWPIIFQLFLVSIMPWLSWVQIAVFTVLFFIEIPAMCFMSAKCTRQQENVLDWVRVLAISLAMLGAAKAILLIAAPGIELRMHSWHHTLP